MQVKTIELRRVVANERLFVSKSVQTEMNRIYLMNEGHVAKVIECNVTEDMPIHLQNVNGRIFLKKCYNF